MVAHAAASARSLTQRVGLFLGPALAGLVWLTVDLDPLHPETTRMAAVALLMSVWWISDAIPLYATALLPLVLFPLLGILSGRATAPVYVNSTIFLFIGGFMIALSMERWSLHRRIALAIVRSIGGGPSRLVLGFMIASAFLSMWISNTATTQMILPILAAMAVDLEMHPLLLMIPATLSASCAFMMPVATPPNAIVFGSGRLRIAEMARVGLLINLMGVLVITLVFVTVGAPVFGIEGAGLPAWARAAH